ncbi:unnamed protein product [Heterosigma akashiwo]
MDAMKNAKDKVKETLTGVKNAPGVKNGWFSESEVMWPGQKFSLQVEEVVFHQKSDYQDVLVFKSSTYGMVLVLDGVIQLTERDEFAYQEMITHLPMFAHPNPKKVLIIGGGDGGVLREVVKHPTVEKIDMSHRRRSDPVRQGLLGVHGHGLCRPPPQPGAGRRGRVHPARGPRAVRRDRLRLLGPRGARRVPLPARLLRGHGQRPGAGGHHLHAGCQWLHLELIEKVVAACASLFNQVEYGYTTIPTHPSGQIGFAPVLQQPAGRALTSPALGRQLAWPSCATTGGRCTATPRGCPPYAHAAVQPSAKGGLPPVDNEDEEAVAGGGGCTIS